MDESGCTDVVEIVSENLAAMNAALGGEGPVLGVQTSCRRLGQGRLPQGSENVISGQCLCFRVLIRIILGLYGEVYNFPFIVGGFFSL